ncbi:MAG: butyrate kinase [Candidatus Eisenbacteria bacterium]
MAEKDHVLILALNPGSTSTKFGVFEDDRALFKENLRHDKTELGDFAGRPLVDQLELRLGKVRALLRDRAVDAGAFDAVVGRGGLLEPLASGTYAINEKMLADLREARRGDHASNLGAPMARALAAEAPRCRAFIVDPVSVDEWPPVARLSGLDGLDRECLSHALNTKAVAKRHAREKKARYRDLRLVVAHLGSGISVSAHEGGKMVDATNSMEEGAFSTERSGTLPVMKLVELCFSGMHGEKEIAAMIFRKGGLASYLGTKDVRKVLDRIASGDARAGLVFDAMIYQIAKEIGAAATVLEGRVDAVLLTGGMAHASEVVEALSRRVKWIAPLAVYPGEDELQALAEGALRVMRGEEEAIEYA